MRIKISTAGVRSFYPTTKGTLMLASRSTPLTPALREAAGTRRMTACLLTASDRDESAEVCNAMCDGGRRPFRCAVGQRGFCRQICHPLSACKSCAQVPQSTCPDDRHAWTSDVQRSPVQQSLVTNVGRRCAVLRLLTSCVAALRWRSKPRFWRCQNKIVKLTSLPIRPRKRSNSQRLRPGRLQDFIYEPVRLRLGSAEIPAKHKQFTLQHVLHCKLP